MKIYEAMGAKAIDPKDPKRDDKIRKLLSDPFYVGQRKLDGERILVHKFEDGSVKIFGRGTGKYGDRKEKTHLLPHIVDHLVALPNGITLDGEVLYIHPKTYSISDIKNLTFKEDFWKCREIMGSHAEKAITQQEAEGYLHFFVFDVLAIPGVNLIHDRYEDRIKDLNRVFEIYIGPMNPFVHLLPVHRTYQDKMELAKITKELKLEGYMLKNINGTYHEGKKPTNQWVKIKKRDPADGVIIGYSKPNQFTERQLNGKPMLDENGQPVLETTKYFLNNWIGAIWIGQYIQEDKVTKIHLGKFREMDYGPYMKNYQMLIDGIVYKLVPIAKISGMDEKLRETISNNCYDYLGKVVAFEYFDKTNDSYFQPTFQYIRDDKPMEECIWE